MMPRKRVEKHRGTYGLIALGLLGASLYMTFNIWDTYKKYKESNRRLEASVVSIDELQGQLDQLKNKQAHASSTSGIESQIRTKFALSKPDEKVVFITTEEEKPEPPKPEGFQKIISTFKNFFN